ncbi:MAG TPA: hypothetical protein VGL55_11005 [Steroidobacteraceae bacterium]|jgi:hypothetical protein
MRLSKYVTYIALLAMLCATASANAEEFSLSGVVVGVDGPTLGYPFLMGQTISGCYYINLRDHSNVNDPSLDIESLPYGVAIHTLLDSGFSGFTVQIGAVTFAPRAPLQLQFFDGPAGMADEMRLVTLFSIADHSPNPRLFGFIGINLYDPTGTGYTQSTGDVDLSKFTIGTVETEVPGSSGDFVDGVVLAQAPPRSVPEPDVLLLMLTGFVPLGCSALAQRRRLMIAARRA